MKNNDFSNICLPVTEIQRFCMHDGPGTRTTVFFKGCPLRCAWCHNPETQSTKNEIMYYPQKCIGCGICADVCDKNAHSFSDLGHWICREECKGCGACAENCPSGALETACDMMSVKEIMDVVSKDAAFYGSKGGITLSGGEPLIHKDGAIALLTACRQSGIGTAVETCGYFDGALLEALAPLTDIMLWDVKDTNDARHIQNTGVSNKIIMDNLCLADSLGIKTVMRCIMINEINMDKEHYDAVAAIYGSLKNCVSVELIPYHAYGGSKAVAIGRTDNGRREWIPSADSIESVKEYLKCKGVSVR